MRQLFFIFFILITAQTYAVRPFITDDAAVVGRRLLQLETWAMFNRFSGEQWNMLAYGPNDRLEFSVGGVWGYDRPQSQRSEFSYATPLVQAKYLFREFQTNQPPGVAMVVGTALPTGKGAFVPSGHGAYGFLAFTQCFGENENVLIHGTVGANYLNTNNQNKFIGFLGIGTQIRAYKGLHVVAEIVSGDPFEPGTGLIYQTGFRYFINDLIQLDATIGQGIAGKEKVPFWGSFGARFVMTKFEKKK
ncbi:MAG: hypothetical protein LBP96_01005 [Bacteroidales bacterium]|jgi:hypothetical protein|nr:hypothetical protein [Bacteroidales bacterium]